MKTAGSDLLPQSFFVATIRSVEGKESSKQSPERLTICRFISMPFRYNESRQQLLATRQTCSRIREDGFPFPGSLRRHGRATHPAARKVHKPCSVVGLRWWALPFIVSTVQQSASPFLSLLLSQLFKTQRQVTARDKTSVTFLSVVREFYFKECAK